MKEFALDGIAGKMHSSVSPVTKTRVSVYHSAQAGFDSSQGAKYSTVCEDHGNIIATSSVSAAKSASRNPSDWCEDCQEKGKTLTDHFNTGAAK
jgi:hypothetical protein